MSEKPATGPWRTDEPPKDKPILACFKGKYSIVENRGDYWGIVGTIVLYAMDPDKWAEILEEE